jgi:hypothetical protein
MVPLNIYNITIIQYNPYQEFKFKLHYINGTSEPIWRGSSMGYACCHTCFHTIIVYSVASRYFTPIYTMEVRSSFGGTEKFSGRRSNISLREFKVTFSIVVFELELKYGTNYTKAFAFKQLACFVHYEALDVYEQHFLRILGVTQIPNPAYAIAIATTS